MNAAHQRSVIVAALRAAGIGQPIRDIRDLSGGCIHRAVRITLDDDSVFVAKINGEDRLNVFQEESLGLHALQATRTVEVPRTLAIVVDSGLSALLMTFIAPSGQRCSEEASWQTLGVDLAGLHLAPLAPELNHRYGFTIDNHLGSTMQPNGWIDDWVDFNTQRRLGHQLRLAVDRGLLDAHESRSVEHVIERLSAVLPRRPRVSLLHGDLWAGNVLPCDSTSGCSAPRCTCAVIDPAPSVGDALADIAMMMLFGGMPAACFNAWAERMGIDPHADESRLRIAVYQLYHVLNHVNIFGRGYAGQAMALTSAILRS